MDGTGRIWVCLFVCVLIFAVWMTGLADWALETVDDASTSDAVCAVSGTGEPHLVYCSGGLWYAHRDGGTWQRELVDGEDCAYVSLELDSAGRPHISYYSDYPNRDLRYAWYDGTNWQITTVDSYAGTYTSLALDSAGRPHISYCVGVGGDLKYAWYDGTNWQITTVDSYTKYTSLALDSADRPHISYYNYANGDLKYAWYDGTNWQITRVDVVGSVGYYTSLALDSADRPHISYYDSTNGDLKYAWYDGTNWQITTVDSAGNVGKYTSLALDSADRPHISYHDSTNYDLKYAWYDGTAWHATRIDAVYPGYGGTRLGSLVLDELDQPHVGYVNSSEDACYAFLPLSNLSPVADAGPDQLVVDKDGSGNEDVKLYGGLSYDRDGSIVQYSWRAGGVEVATGVSPTLTLPVGSHTFTLVVTDNDGATAQDAVVVTVVSSSEWAVETVDEIEVGVGIGVAISAAGRPHISYYDQTNGDLKYAWYDGTNWQITTVDSAGNVGKYTSLALDSADRPHISYYDQTNGDLKYAWYDGTNWQITTVESAGNVGQYTSLALDSADRPHISYYDSTDGDLKYARYLSELNMWVITTVDSYTEYTSLALDSADRPHISYYANGDLKYAWYDGTNWQITRVDVVGSVGYYTSLALDSADRPHISYYDQTNGDLKYAWYDGTNWQITTVDSAGTVGRYTSLALDSADRPHISYHDSTNYDLRYARYDGGTWLVTTVDDAVGYAGGYTALALAPDGAVHIGYKGTLKHASMRPASPGTAAVFRVDRATGDVLADGAFYGSEFYSGSADVAEWVLVSEPVEPGDVLEIDPENPDHYRKARGPCSQLVAGVVSTEPGFVLGHGEDTEGKVLLALMGIVPVKVTDEGGPIRPGDLLVVSSTPGYAMKWDPDSGLCGFVGKALEPWEEGEGVILVLLMR